jgi:hypothetical protein
MEVIISVRDPGARDWASVDLPPDCIDQFKERVVEYSEALAFYYLQAAALTEPTPRLSNAEVKARLAKILATPAPTSVYLACDKAELMQIVRKAVAEILSEITV